MISLIVSVLIGFFSTYVAHVLYWRAKPSYFPRIYLLSVMMAAGVLLGCLTYGLLSGFDIEMMFVSAAVVSFLHCGYLYFYCGICRSVSLTLLWRLWQAGDKPVALKVLTDEYSASSRFEDRLDVMRASGAIEIVDKDRVILTPHGKRVAFAVRIISKTLSGGLEG